MTTLTFSGHQVDVAEPSTIARVINRIGDDHIAEEFKDLLRWSSTNVDALLADAIANHINPISHEMLARRYGLELADITERVPQEPADVFFLQRELAFVELCRTCGLDDNTEYDHATVTQVITDFRRNKIVLEATQAVLAPEAQRLLTHMGVARQDVARPWEYLAGLGRIDVKASDEHRALSNTWSLYAHTTVYLDELNAIAAVADPAVEDNETPARDTF